MSLLGLDHRQHERSYAPYPTDSGDWYVGEVCNGPRGGTGPGELHIRQQTQIERDIAEDGAEDSGSLEDGPGQIPAPGRTDLHETRGIMNKRLWIATGIMLAGILMGNLGGIWLASTL